MNLFLSGFVQRYHAHPTMARYGQTNGHHQWGVAMLSLMLHPRPTRDLLVGALTHDAGELLTGDLPHPFKMLLPEMAKMVARVEKDETADMLGWVPDLSDEDEMWIALCDRLESILFVRETEPRLLERADWRSLVTQAIGKAARLRVEDQVREMLG